MNIWIFRKSYVSFLCSCILPSFSSTEVEVLSVQLVGCQTGGAAKKGGLDTSLEQCLLLRFIFYVFPNLMKLSFADLTSMQKKMNWWGHQGWIFWPPFWIFFPTSVPSAFSLRKGHRNMDLDLFFYFFPLFHCKTIVKAYLFPVFLIFRIYSTSQERAVLLAKIFTLGGHPWLSSKAIEWS